MRKMTQDEYNKLTDEEQNALVATEVLGWFTNKHRIAWFLPGNMIMEMGVKTFNPKHNLDHAIMLVEELECSYSLSKTITDEKTWYTAGLIIEINSKKIRITGMQPTLNGAIMLACLKVKGIIK